MLHDLLRPMSWHEIFSVRGILQLLGVLWICQTFIYPVIDLWIAGRNLKDKERNASDA